MKYSLHFVSLVQCPLNVYEILSILLPQQFLLPASSNVFYTSAKYSSQFFSLFLIHVFGVPSRIPVLAPSQCCAHSLSMIQLLFSILIQQKCSLKVFLPKIVAIDNYGILIVHRTASDLFGCNGSGTLPPHRSFHLQFYLVNVVRDTDS